MYNIKRLISNKPKLGLWMARRNISPPLPLFLLIHITLKCTRSCPWCYQMWDDFYAARREHIDTGAFEAVLRSFKYFKPHIHLFGGEPLCHPEFSRLLRLSATYGYQPTLTTNADNLDMFREMLCISSVSQINISLNTFVGDDGILKVPAIRALDRFVGLNRGRKTVNLNYLVSPGKYRHLENLLDQLELRYSRSDISFVCLQQLNRTLTSVEEKDFNEEELKAVASLQISVARRKLAVLFLPDLPLEYMKKYFSREACGGECCVPWFGLSLYPDLAVTPGGGLFTCNHVLGNAGNTPLIEIWKGHSIRKFRLMLLRNGLPADCNTCCHKQYKH